MPKTQTQKSILEETFAEIASIKESLSNNASELLNGDLKTELKNIVATAINEGNDFDDDDELENTEDIAPAGGENIPDIPSDDTEIEVSGNPEEDMAGDLPPTDASLTGADADLPIDELPPMGDVTDVEDDIVDLTGASDEEVLQVFKKMGPEDEIEVVQNPEGDIGVKLGEDEYIIKNTGAESEVDLDDGIPQSVNLGAEDEVVDDDSELPPDIMAEGDYKEEAARIKANGNSGNSGDRTDIKAAATKDAPTVAETSPIKDNENGNSDKRDDVKKPTEKDVAEVGGGGKVIDTNVTKNQESGKSDKRTDVKQPKEKGVAEVETTSGNVSMEASSTPNYDRGTKSTPVTDTPTVNSNTTVGIAESKLKKKLDENHDKLVYTRQKYAEAVADNATLRDQINQLNENVESFKTSETGYKGAIKTLREQFNEVALFTSNLTYAVKLMTEHATTREEKTQILERFEKAATLSESKVVYESIAATFGASIKKSVSIDEQLNKNTTSGASAINESTAYENPDLGRMKELMKKMK